MRTRITLLLLLSAGLRGAVLKPESLEAWNRYVSEAEAKMAARTQPGGTFLWLDESPERRRRAQGGEIAVAETYSPVSRKIPGAMIHDWTGAAFLPGAKIDDVLAVLRNYDNYTEYYPPSVGRSKTVAKSATADRFSLLLLNQTLIVKTAIESDYQATFTELTPTRWYGKTTSTRIQEIADYGSKAEHRLPPGHDDGYIWRLESLSRLEERDGGVYFEIEALALSRDVPVSLRFLVDPIIRRVSRNALAESLKQTEKAVAAEPRSVKLAANH